MRPAACNTGPEFHGLDHIAPLADLMKMPLLVSEEKNFELALRYYPQIEVRYVPDFEFQLGNLAEQFDILFECKYWMPQLQSLFRELHQKEMRLIFCPHGQSDKGFQAPLLAPYATQDGVLLYGDLMIEMLKELGVWSSISRYAVVGNYRLHFYQKYKKFYDDLIENEIPIDRKKKTVVYAPTWRDADQATSFFSQGKKVIEELPSDWNLIVKVHPLLEQRDPAHYYSIAAAIEQKRGILLHEFPLVYPVLELADCYLGDASSVGYDFLYFEKPLYFFPKVRGRLDECGVCIDPNQNLYKQLERENSLREKQKALYRFAFGSGVADRETILKAIG